MAEPIRNIQQISAGSYGTIYKYPGSSKVYKVHQFTDAADTCADYKKEYNIQQEIFDTCDKILRRKCNTSIVQPITFHYSTRSGISENKISLNIKEKQEEADSCFFEMEYIPPFRPPTGKTNKKPTSEKQLKTFLKAEKLESFLRSSQIPPYIYTATNRDVRGHFTLDNLKGANQKSIPWDEEKLSYYEISSDSPADFFMRQSTKAFFCLLVNGYMPRDIEIVYNLKTYDKPNVIMSILDFNQVETLEDRKKNKRGGVEYDLEKDIAHVYIDLIGIRRAGTENPMYPDIPTQGWFFMISPKLSPTGFFDICKELYNILNTLKVSENEININIGKFAKYVLEYQAESIPLEKPKRWTTGTNYFYTPLPEEGTESEIEETRLLNSSCTAFDILLQERIINEGLHIYDTAFTMATYDSDKSFSAVLAYLEDKRKQRSANLVVGNEEGWGEFSLFGGKRFQKKRKTRRYRNNKRRSVSRKQR